MKALFLFTSLSPYNLDLRSHGQLLSLFTFFLSWLLVNNYFLLTMFFFFSVLYSFLPDYPFPLPSLLNFHIHFYLHSVQWIDIFFVVGLFAHIN